MDAQNVKVQMGRSDIGVRAGGLGGEGQPSPVSDIFGQNAQNSGDKETIKDGIKKFINKAKIKKKRALASIKNITSVS